MYSLPGKQCVHLKTYGLLPVLHVSSDQNMKWVLSSYNANDENYLITTWSCDIFQNSYIQIIVIPS